MTNAMRPTIGTIRGCFYGLAIGDSLGAPTEFLTRPEILARWPPRGPTEPEGEVVGVTDDTQMALAVGEALTEDATRDPAALAARFGAHFVRWFVSPENNRAPGMTCMRACGRLDEGVAWSVAGDPNSKGCGANMRVAPVAFLADEHRCGAAQLQSALTHRHPTALAAADLTAHAVWMAGAQVAPADFLNGLSTHIDEHRGTYEHAWVPDVWHRVGVTTPEEFMERGWDECSRAIERVAEARTRYTSELDPCDLTGEGWCAEEALATALLCFLSAPDDPLEVVRLTAAASGDSDSIGCIAGALAGARSGVAGWPAAWVERVEYADRIEAIAAALSAWLKTPRRR